MRTAPDASNPARAARLTSGLSAVVLAAGHGRRMRSAIPKVLHQVAGAPMVSYPIRLARELGARRVIVVHAPGQDRLLGETCEGCTLVAQPRALGTGHALNQVPAALRTTTEVLVLYGDVPLLTLDTIRRMIELRRSERLDCVLLAARVGDPFGYGRIVFGEGGPQIVEQADATDEEALIDLVNTGVAVFSGAALWPQLGQLPRSRATGEYYLTRVFGRLPRRAVIECSEEEALGVNDRWQLAAAERVVRTRINRAHAEQGGVTIVDPSTTYIDVGVTIDADSIIEPFTFLRGNTRIGGGCRIGPFAEITDSLVGQRCVVGRSQLVESTVEDDVVIGPFNRLRTGSVVAQKSRIGNFAEIKNSLVGANSDVHHFSYLGDAVLGKGVNIGAGTVTANYNGREKLQTVIGDGVFIGSDTTLVAPVSVGDRAYTAAGSVITRDVAAEALAIERAEQREVAGYRRRRTRP